VNYRCLLQNFILIVMAGIIGSTQDAYAGILEEETVAPVVRPATKAVAVKRKRVSRLLKRTTKYNALIARQAARQGIPVKLAHAIVRVESNYNPRARGRAGEIGLMQLLPATARGIGYRGKMRNLYDPNTNLIWGMKYLGKAYRKAGGNVCGTVMRYNAGLYAKRQTRQTARYCRRVKVIMRKG